MPALFPHRFCIGWWITRGARPAPGRAVGAPPPSGPPASAPTSPSPAGLPPVLTVRPHPPTPSSYLSSPSRYGPLGRRCVASLPSVPTLVTPLLPLPPNPPLAFPSPPPIVVCSLPWRQRPAKRSFGRLRCAGCRGRRVPAMPRPEPGPSANPAWPPHPGSSLRWRRGSTRLRHGACGAVATQAARRPAFVDRPAKSASAVTNVKRFTVLADCSAKAADLGTA